MTPQGEHDDKDADDRKPGEPGTSGARRSEPVTADLGWDRPAGSQPPGDRITWESTSATTLEPSSGSSDVSQPAEGSPRASDERPPVDPASIPPPPGAPGAPKAPEPARPTPPTTLRRSATAATTAATPATTRATVPIPARTPPEPTPTPEPTPAPAHAARPPEPPAARADDTADELKAQLAALARQEASERAAERSPGDRRGVERTSPALAELAQQLTATQSQVAALAAQLTTLSHRISYDIERSAQTTSERLVRDLGTIPDAVRTGIGKDLGPAIDDLTDQIETDRTKLGEAVAGVQSALAPRLTSIGDIVDALPLSNVEILNALQGVGTEIEDRFTRFAARVGDQLAALERSHAAELTRLRTQVDDVRASLARPNGDHEALDRMAGQVERLVQRTPSSQEVVEALELVVSEHLEVLRDNLDTRVAALAPTLQQELESVRIEAQAGMAATEEVLAERVEALEASLVERTDLALADQIDAFDALVTDRHGQLLGAIRAEAEATAEAAAAAAAADTDDDDGTAEIAGAVAASSQRLDEMAAALAEISVQVAEVAARPAPVAAPAEVDGAALAAIGEELKALRRRISLRLEGGDSPLTPEQVASLAAEIAAHLH